MKLMKWILPLMLILMASCQYEDDYFTDEDGFDNIVPEEEDYGQDHDHAVSGEEGMLTLYRVQGGQIDRIENYNVSGQLLDFQQDYDKHFKMWEFTKRLIPAKELGRVTEFMVFYGEDDLAGYVQPVDEGDLSAWRMGLAIDLADKLEEIDFANFFTYVTVHEFGHIATLNETQVDVNVSENSCGNYFPGEGCAKSNSYIDKLYDLAWSDIYDGEDSDKDLYSQYPDRFVSDYAATNPAEDIAEVFAFFITKANMPSGNTIADQKIKMLYDFPELVSLREQMRAGSETLRAMKPGSWYDNPYIKKYRFGKCTHKHAATF